MTVAVDATGTSDTHTAIGAGPISFAKLTTTSAAQLIVVMVGYTNLSTSPATRTVTWDSTQTLTSLLTVTRVNGSKNEFLEFYGLINPTTFGAKTISVAWTGATQETYVDAISFTGVVTTSLAAAVPNNNTSVSTPSTLAVTSVSGDIALAAWGSINNLSTPGQTLLFLDTVGTDMTMAANYTSAVGASTSLTIPGSDLGFIIDIAAAPAASAPVKWELFMRHSYLWMPFAALGWVIDRRRRLK